MKKTKTIPMNIKNLKLLYIIMIFLSIQLNSSLLAEDISPLLQEAISTSESSDSDSEENNETVFTKWAGLSQSQKVIASVTCIALTIITFQLLLYAIHGLSDRPPFKVKPCTDQKILELFNTIKKDMGIEEDIPLFTTTESGYSGKYMRNISKIPFNFTTKLTGISLNLDMMKDNYCRLINIIAHELGHHQQFTDAQATYQSKKKSIAFFLFGSSTQKQDDAKKLEIGADATAAGYQDCVNCLKHIQIISFEENSPQNSKGYFCDTDYEPYIQRATEEGWQCPAHANNGAPDSIAHFFLDFKKYEPQNFLPQTYDRSNYKPFTMETE